MCIFFFISLRLVNLLRKIIMIAFKPTISEESLSYLELAISKYIDLHKKYYDKSFPKLHYLVHLPDDIRR